MIIRSMMQEDVAGVAALEAELFSVPWSQAAFEDTIPREEVLFFVAGEGDELLGYIGVTMTAQEGEITNVAVASEARRGGVGTALLMRLKEELYKRGIFRIVLEVRVSNMPAIRLYEKIGFSIVGTRKRFYEKPTEDAYVMVLE